MLKGLSIAGRKQNSQFDFYQTPEWATKALLDREKFGKSIWEPACGKGAISKVLREYGYYVKEDDIQKDGISFLDREETHGDIITNPPYNLATEFVEHALTLTTGKLALFMKLTFLESERRYKLFTTTPLKTVYVFCKRVQLYLDGQPIPKNSGTIAFAWFVWDKKYAGEPTLKWIGGNSSRR